MKLTKKNKKLIIDEFTYVINKMAESENPEKTLYYFTGIHTMIQRILNIEYSDELLFVHYVMEKVYHSAIDRMHRVKSGDVVIMFHEKFGDKLIELTKKIRDCFDNKEDRINALQELVVLAYTTTGNGYYLTEKGMINIFLDKKHLKNK